MVDLKLNYGALSQCWRTAAGGAVRKKAGDSLTGTRGVKRKERGSSPRLVSEASARVTLLHALLVNESIWHSASVAA